MPRPSILVIGMVLAGVYSAIVAVTAHAHEPWADEAQSWLIARDASLLQIWTKLVRLEGSPGLWHSLLHFLISLGLPYSALNYLSGVLGLAAALVVFFFAPFPAVIRALLPFTYFLCFQYEIIARNYSLAPVLLFSAAAAYCANRNRLLLVLLILLALVSAQALLLSVAFAAAIAFQNRRDWQSAEWAERKNMAMRAAVYVAALLLIVIAVWPNRHTVFFVSPNWSAANFVTVSRYGFQQAFGDAYWPACLIALTIPLLGKGPGLFFFVLSSFSLCIFGSVVYSNVWHHGYLVLAWLTAIWISIHPDRRNYLALGGLGLFMLLQCSWTWNGVRYDRKNAYSGSREMARLLQTRLHPHSKVFGIGFPTVGIQPYFPSNLYANYGAGAPHQSFWAWSKENNANDAAERLGTEHPDLVVLGYSSDSDQKLWGHLITQSGYHQVAHTEGNLFWRTGAFQPENFQLFAPGSQVSDSPLLSEIVLSEPKGDVQLMSGITGAPTPEGREIAHSGQVDLQRPSLPLGQHASRLEMNFVISNEQFGQTGPMNLTVYVGGHRMPSMKLNRAGRYRYTSNVPSDALFWAVVPVAFQFEKAGPLAPAIKHDPVATLSEIGLFAQ
ncbi:MAG: hypothetical protein ACJ746_21305 [Bryobacteraceae bacterium]